MGGQIGKTGSVRKTRKVAFWRRLALNAARFAALEPKSKERRFFEPFEEPSGWRRAFFEPVSRP
jgi:hypothetical protein